MDFPDSANMESHGTKCPQFHGAAPLSVGDHSVTMGTHGTEAPL